MENTIKNSFGELKKYRLDQQRYLQFENETLKEFEKQPNLLIQNQDLMAIVLSSKDTLALKEKELDKRRRIEEQVLITKKDLTQKTQENMYQIAALRDKRNSQLISTNSRSDIEKIKSEIEDLNNMSLNLSLNLETKIKEWDDQSINKNHDIMVQSAIDMIS